MLALTFMEAALGTERTFKASVQRQCTACTGSGLSASLQPVDCTGCNGTGQTARCHTTSLGTLPPPSHDLHLPLLPCRLGLSVNAQACDATLYNIAAARYHLLQLRYSCIVALLEGAQKTHVRRAIYTVCAGL